MGNFYYQDLISTKIKKRIEVDEEIKPRKKYRSRKKKIVVTKDDFKPAIDKKASGVLSVDYKAKLNLIHSLHKDIVELRSKLSYSDMLKIQEQLGETINYKGDVVVIGDKDKKRIMVHYPKSDMYPDKTFTKICFIKPGNIFGYGHLFENDKIVKNYDFNEPYSMPFMLKYCSQKEMDEILSDKNFICLIKTAINKMTKLKEKLESSKNI